MKEELVNMYTWLHVNAGSYNLVALCTDMGHDKNPHFITITKGGYGGGLMYRVSNELYKLVHDDFPDTGTYSLVLDYINMLHRKFALDDLIDTI